MAASATNITIQKIGLRDRLAVFFGRLGGALMHLTKASAMDRELRALNAMSDAQLAQKGLTRADIPRYVLRNVLYV